jgi:hypothetical protein
LSFPKNMLLVGTVEQILLHIDMGKYE